MGRAALLAPARWDEPPCELRLGGTSRPASSGSVGRAAVLALAWWDEPPCELWLGGMSRPASCGSVSSVWGLALSPGACASLGLAMEESGLAARMKRISAGAEGR